jgi:hypothetical protein
MEPDRGFAWQPFASWACLMAAFISDAVFWEDADLIQGVVVIVCLAFGFGFAISGIRRSRREPAFFFSYSGLVVSAVWVLLLFNRLIVYWG